MTNYLLHTTLNIIIFNPQNVNGLDVRFNNPFLIELKVDKNLSIFAINYILGKKTISITLMEFYISNGNTAVSDAQM